MLINNQLIGFGSGGEAGAATVTYVSKAVITTDTTTYTFSSQALGDEAADRKIVIAIAAGNTSGGITSVTVAGNSATSIISVYNVASRSSLFYVDLASGTSGDIVVTFGGTLNRCGIGVYNVNGASSGAEHDSGSSTADPMSVDVDLPANGCVIAVACTANILSNPWATWVGVTEDYDEATESSSSHSGASDTFTAADATKTVECTSNRAGPNDIMVAASFSP